MQKYVEQARVVPDFHGVGRITPHVFRHSRAVHMLQTGINLVYIRDLLGHATIASTEIYARADTEMKRKALESASLSFNTGDLAAWDKDGELMEWLTNRGK